MEAGEILEEVAVTQEEEEVAGTQEEVAVTQEEEVAGTQEEEVAGTQEEEEIPFHKMTNSQGNNPPFSKEIADDQKHSYRSGTFIEESIDTPHKWATHSHES